MRNLRLFIIKNYFFFLFLVFEIISLSFLINSNDYQKSTFLNSSNSAIAFILEKKSDLTEYLYLRKMNEELLKTNSYLLQQEKKAWFQLRKGQVAIRDSNEILQYRMLPAKVINSTANKQDNYLTINRGSDDGIKSEMGVSNGISIVGIIKDVSPHYATVISVLNKNFVLSVKVKRTNDHGTINWEGLSDDEVLLSGITVDAPIQKGDTIVTRGNSPKFPENILVGTVREVFQEPGSMHHSIRVELSTNFNNLYHVYVIENQFQQEQLELEKLLIPVEQ